MAMTETAFPLFPSNLLTIAMVFLCVLVSIMLC
jgi:hypothetical protein